MLYQDKIFENNINNVSVENDSYTLIETDDPLAWENFYGSKVEPLMSQTIESICQLSSNVLLTDKVSVLDDKAKQNLAFTMVIWIKATKHNRISAELLDMVGGVKCNAYLQ